MSLISVLGFLKRFWYYDHFASWLTAASVMLVKAFFRVFARERAAKANWRPWLLWNVFIFDVNDELRNKNDGLSRKESTFQPK